MLEKYLNNEVRVLIRTPGMAGVEKEEGIMTSVSTNGQFIELDNKKLINTISILQIILK